MLRFGALIFIGILFALPCQASESYQYDIGAGLQYYSGLKDKSLAPNTATVVRFGAQNGDAIFRGIADFYLLSSSGQSSFSDSGTSTTLSYSLIGGEFNIGFAIYPLNSLSHLPLQPYFGGAASVHIDSISFDKNAPVSATFPKSESPMMFGYSIFVGTDLAFSKNWGLKLRVEQSAVTGTVATSPFSMGGQRVLVGVYFE